MPEASPAPQSAFPKDAPMVPLLLDRWLQGFLLSHSNDIPAALAAARYQQSLDTEGDGPEFWSQIVARLAFLEFATRPRNRTTRNARCH